MATFWGPVAFAQTTAGDSLVVEMNQAFKRGDRKKLAALLPQARGHALEPYAAYWELKARLDQASARDVQDFFARYPGTYQEDRLRADWLLLLGQRRDWPAFEAEYSNYRMATHCWLSIRKTRQPTRACRTRCVKTGTPSANLTTAAGPLPKGWSAPKT